MIADSALRTMAGICTAILVAAALMLAQSVLAPVAFALFLIALAWPLQRRLEPVLGGAVAMIVTLLVTLTVVAVMVFLAAWGFGRVGRWVTANAGMLQELYLRKLEWAAAQGIEIAPVLAEHFNARSLVRLAQEVLSQLQGLLTFVAVTLVFMILGLLETGAVARSLRTMGGTADALLGALAETSAKLRTYMAVRTVMSALTGLAVFAFARAMGLELAAEWGVIAFVLNYIPFIGSFLATLFPTVFAILQFGSWQAAIAVFACLQVIQFLSGSYIEPRLAGARLAISPFMVLVAVFVGAFLWGVPGAFIGVPALIAALTICERFDGSRWVATLLSGK
jgi:predicted PurR-regulated permease PerM